MEHKFIMTAFGKDRPGIVAQIAQIIFENGCNLEDSNMGRLADEFTLILLLSGKNDDIHEKLSKDCKRLEREKDIFVFIRSLDYNIPDTKNGNSLCIIEVEGIDQAGIVYKISKLLSDHDINIESLKSKKNFLPNSGTALYSMVIKAKMPGEISMDEFCDKLENLAEALQVDISIK